MVKYFSAFFVCWHFVKLKIFLFPGPQFRIGVMSAVRDGKSYLRWDRPDTLLHWWQLLGWGGDTLGLWSKIFFYEELYKRTGWQWKGDSWCWQQQIQKVFPEILSIFNLKRPILLILNFVTLCLVWGEDRQDENEQRVMREIGPHGIIWSSFGTSQANMDQAIYNITRHCKRLPSWIELLGVSIDFFSSGFFILC